MIPLYVCHWIGYPLSFYIIAYHERNAANLGGYTQHGKNIYVLCLWFYRSVVLPENNYKKGEGITLSQQLVSLSTDMNKLNIISYRSYPALNAFLLSSTNLGLTFFSI